MIAHDTVAIDVSRIDQQLIKVNVTDAVISRLHIDYAHLAEKPIETKEEYDIVHRADMNMRDLQTLTVSTCKKGREQAIAEQKAWIAKEREVVGRIAEVRDPVTARKDEWNEIEQRKMEEAAQVIARMIEARKKRLFDVGFRFDGTKYVLDGFAECTEEQINGKPGDELEFADWISNLERQVNEHREREEEKARIKKIADDALAAQQKAEAERQAQVAAEQQRKADELAAKEAEINGRVLAGRVTQIIAAGGVEYPDGSIGFGATVSSASEIIGMEETAFATMVELVREKARVFAETLKEQEKQREAERIDREARIAKEAVERAERERIAAEARAKEEEAERVAKMSDGAKLKDYHRLLLAVPIPEMKSKAGQDAIARIGSILNVLLKKP